MTAPADRRLPAVLDEVRARADSGDIDALAAEWLPRARTALQDGSAPPHAPPLPPGAENAAETLYGALTGDRAPGTSAAAPPGGRTGMTAYCSACSTIAAVIYRAGRLAEVCAACGHDDTHRP